MRSQTFTDAELLELIDVKKLSQAEAARLIGVSRQAIHKRLQEIRTATTHAALVEKNSQRLIDRKLNAIDRLEQLEEASNSILNYALQIIVNDPDKLAQLALKALAESRNQLKLRVDMFQAIFSVQEVQEFQRIVLQAIGEADLDARNRIIKGMNELATARGIRYD